MYNTCGFLHSVGLRDYAAANSSGNSQVLLFKVDGEVAKYYSLVQSNIGRS